MNGFWDYKPRQLVFAVCVLVLSLLASSTILYSYYTGKMVAFM